MHTCLVTDSVPGKLLIYALQDEFNSITVHVEAESSELATDEEELRRLPLAFSYWFCCMSLQNNTHGEILLVRIAHNTGAVT